MSLEHDPLRDRPRPQGSGSPFMNQDAAAEFLGLSPRTLERFRLEGRGPDYRKFGRRCLYHQDDLLTWAEAQRRTSTSDPRALA